MRKLPKKQFDEIIKLTREYWATGKKILLSQRTSNALDFAIMTGLNWLSVLDLLDSLLRNGGLCTDAENDEIYSVLRVIGWEVTDDEEQESESV